MRRSHDGDKGRLSPTVPYLTSGGRHCPGERSWETRDIHAVQQLAAFPMSGKAGRVLGTRELAISHTPFIAAYAIDRADIIILAIYHGAQQWPESF
jgi:ParE toxin of type II toxin-antitoxin system, parDE